MLANRALDLIGNTPVVRVDGLDAGPCELFVKLESANPGGSIKDRIGLSMIAAAEREGTLSRGHLVEATAGNTGLGLALVAAQKGYRLTLVIPDKMFNDFWMADQGFVERASTGDLRDVIARRHEEGAVVTVGPKDTLLVAYARMKLYDVSQLPVLDGGRIVGIVDESDLLAVAVEDEARLRGPVEDVMTRRLTTVRPTTPVRELLPIFQAGMVPLVMDGDRFLGLVTQIDLLNHLRRRMR